METYKATCNLPKGKKSFTTTFRHPQVKDKEGKYGRKIHRGLGTSDEQEASELVEQLNKMMEDDYWWNVAKKSEAYLRYDDRIVDAFYDPMEQLNLDEAEFLDKIVMPEKKDGYTKVTIIGSSGAGKTSLLRLLSGTSKEKYPTTSTGRTTTCNMEMIMSSDEYYEVVVTFMSRALLEVYIQECIENAIQYYLSCEPINRNRETVSDKLLIHKDLIVRLSYILGDLTLEKKTATSTSDDYDDYDLGNIDSEVEKSKYEFDQNIPELLEKINDFIDQLIALTDDYEGKNIDDEAFNLEDNGKALSLIDDIINEVQLRFSFLIGGEKLNSKGKWLNAWYYKTNDREEFIKIVKKFSSNAKNVWGGLLTPIVKTIRVKGNFKPDFENEVPKLVLFDGQGFGHKTTATSISLDTVEKFKVSNSIILVDNATAPVLGNVKLALKSIIELGYATKLLMCYTHVDLMKGDNFTNFTDIINHIKAALSTYLMELKKQSPLIFSEIEERKVLKSCYYLLELDKIEIHKITQTESQKILHELKEHLKDSITTDDVRLTYDAMTLYTHLQVAINNYRQNWGNIIGHPFKTEKTEHWTRIKALTKRLGCFGLDHYNYQLMPLADFAQEIREQLNLFLNRPLDIKPDETDEAVKVAHINKIKSEINDKLLEFIRTEMWTATDPMGKWQEAYNYRGGGSGYLRALKINEIFELGAPPIDNLVYNMTNAKRRYVMKFLEIVESVITERGGTLEKFNF